MSTYGPAFNWSALGFGPAIAHGSRLRQATQQMSNGNWIYYGRTRASPCFLDDAARRTQVILLTLRILKENKNLTTEQERWLPFAEKADAAVQRNAREFQIVMLGIFACTVSLTQNPIRQLALVAAILQKMKRENALTAVQLQWAAELEDQLANLRAPVALGPRSDGKITVNLASATSGNR